MSEVKLHSSSACLQIDHIYNITVISCPKTFSNQFYIVYSYQYIPSVFGVAGGDVIKLLSAVVTPEAVTRRDDGD